MAEIGLAVAQTLFAALSCSQLQGICATWGYKSQLEDLNKTVTTIKKVLIDAESKVLTNEAQGYVDELKDALYEADDLFDEFVTLLELEELEKSPSKDDEFFQKVCRFFSSNINQVCQAFRMFDGVTRIQKKLHAIVDNHQKFSLGVDYEPICKRGDETCSYVDVKGIIGRDNDKNTIIDKLLKSKDQQVCFLTIVGVGGLGKTALAQLVYNDEKLKKVFGDSMLWVCVSDQEKSRFDVKAILCKILELVTHKKSYDTYSLETVQIEFQKQIRENKYLLILDDVWNEDRKKWVGLETLLMLGQGGSRVLVTTRSEITATVIGGGWTYRLQGLSPDNAWNLFEMTAFNKGKNQQYINHIEMVDVGKKIVGKCNNIPLAIKVVGSLLYGQDINKWRSFAKSGLAEIDNGDKKIMDVLKFSYHNLSSSLKRCFSYCAVFPKDFEIKKVLLINLWIAQGYIEPLNGGQSVEDAAEEHFTILLRRCFFQDVKKNDYDEIVSVKIHDLMHDVAQEVGRGEVQVFSSVDKTFGDRSRHVIIFDEKCYKNSSKWTNLRTLLRVDYVQISKYTKIGNLRSLRALELKYLKGGISLDSIGELQHLRYLDLSWGWFEELNNSITKLHNLRTLILYGCEKLKRLPRDFSKLVKLSHLNLENCWKLTNMRWGLHNLNDVGALNKITGKIVIVFYESYRNVELTKDMISGGYLNKIPGLKDVSIDMDYVKVQAAEAVLEKLEPHPNLKKLTLKGYGGKTIPWWTSAKDCSATIVFSNLVNIVIFEFKNLVNLPSFSKLPFLKLMELYTLDNLEYMETTNRSDTTFFPSLETLKIEECKKLKGWFKENGLGVADYSFRVKLSFPYLAELSINDCPNLTSFPPCPSVKNIMLTRVNKTSRLLEKMMGKEEGKVTIGNHTSSSPSSSSCLANLLISEDNELESLSEFEKVFEMCASSLRILEIAKCNCLSRFSRGLQHLTALECLYLGDNHQLNFSEDDNEHITAWKPLHQSLNFLVFEGLSSMTSLPTGLQYLTSLHTLELQQCEELKGLPECISCLSSLQSLTIKDCGVVEDCIAIESLPEVIQSLKKENPQQTTDLG